MTSWLPLSRRRAEQRPFQFQVRVDLIQTPGIVGMQQG